MSKTTQLALSAAETKTTQVALRAAVCKTPQLAPRAAATKTPQLALRAAAGKTTQLALSAAVTKTTQLALRAAVEDARYLPLMEEHLKRSYALRHDNKCQPRQVNSATTVYNTVSAEGARGHQGCVNRQHAWLTCSHRVLNAFPSSMLTQHYLQMRSQQKQEHPDADPNMWRSRTRYPNRPYDESWKRRDNSLTTHEWYCKQVKRPLTLACVLNREGKAMFAPPVVSPGMGLGNKPPSSTWALQVRLIPYVLTINALKVLCGVTPVPPGMGLTGVSQSVVFYDEDDALVPPRLPTDQIHTDGTLIYIGGKHTIVQRNTGHFQFLNRAVVTSSYHSAHAINHCSGAVGNNYVQPMWASTMKGFELLLGSQGPRSTRSNCSSSKRNSFQTTRLRIFEELVSVTKPEYYHIILDLMVHFDRILQAQIRAAHDTATVSIAPMRSAMENDILRNCIPVVQLIMLVGNDKLAATYSSPGWLVQALCFLSQPLNSEGQLRVITPHGATGPSFASQLKQVPMRKRSSCLTVQDAEFYFIDPQATSANGIYPRMMQRYTDMDPSWQHQIQILNRILSSSFPFITVQGPLAQAEDEASSEDSGDDMSIAIATALSPRGAETPCKSSSAHTGATHLIERFAVHAPCPIKAIIPQFKAVPEVRDGSVSSDGADPDVLHGFPYEGPMCAVCETPTAPELLSNTGMCPNCPFRDVDEDPEYAGMYALHSLRDAVPHSQQ